MATSVFFRRQREKTAVMRVRYMLDIYMREGDDHFRDGHYKNAIASYDEVLNLDAKNLTAHVRKSQCQQRLGHVKHALADVEKALAVDNIYPLALLQKADLFYSVENYEMALLFYHRGHKVSPDIVSFREGIQNCRKHIIELSRGKTMKLTEAGDLTLYVHKKMRRMDALKDKKEPSTQQTQSRQASSTHLPRRRFANPLVELNRKQPIKLAPVVKASRSTRRTTLSEPDEITAKEFLEELNDDRVYLQNFVRETDEDESRLDAQVNFIAESGLQFLLERITYWSQTRLPPAPTPSPPLSRKHSRQGSSIATRSSPLPRDKSFSWEREVSDLIHKLEEEPLLDSEDAGRWPPGYRPYKKEKKKIRKLSFTFATYRPDSELVKDRHNWEDGKLYGQMKVLDILEDQLKEDDYILNYLIKELKEIEEAFTRGDFEVCRRRGVNCLQTMYSYSDDEVADKLDIIAKVHSNVGNALIELGKYEDAMQHHQKDLQIGECCNIDEPVSRALGNLGRVFTHTKQFHKSLGAFARKAKMVARADEKAWLYHEIGDNFLSLNQYGYARDAGRKSLQAAEEADHQMYQLQACVLIAVAQVKLRDYREAFFLFERALDLAQANDDKESQDMILRALQEVNARMSGRSRERGQPSRDSPWRTRDDLSSSSTSTHITPQPSPRDRVQESPSNTHSRPGVESDRPGGSDEHSKVLDIKEGSQRKEGPEGTQDLSVNSEENRIPPAVDVDEESSSAGDTDSQLDSGQPPSVVSSETSTIPENSIQRNRHVPPDKKNESLTEQNSK